MSKLSLWFSDLYGCCVIVGAVLYYACSVSAVEKLRDPKFYCYEHWTQ